MSLPSLPHKLIVALEGAALAPAPEVLLRLMRAVEDENSTLNEIAGIVDKDPAITARILAAANSSAFHRGHSVVSVEQCLQVLGLRVVRSIAVCLSVQCVFARQAESARIDLSRFWRHSLFSAELARELATEMGYPSPGEAYLGGLLHDVGELALISALKQEYGSMLALAANEDELNKLEIARLGVSHADVGAWLVDQWQLDSSLADSVLFHHSTAEQIAESDMLSRIVWCAHVGASPGVEPDELHAAVAVSGLPIQTLTNLISLAQERVTLLAEAMGIVVKDTQSVLPEASFAEPLPSNDPSNGLLESMAETAILQALQEDKHLPSKPFEMLRAVCESARILFGVERVAFLHYRETSGMLSGVEFAEASVQLVGTRLSLSGSSSSIAARALRERRILSSHKEVDTSTAVLADIQFCRVLKSDGFVGLPLLMGSHPLGVMLLGTSVSQQARLLSSSSWLQSFARVAAQGFEAATLARSDTASAALASLGREQQIKRFSHEVGNPLSIIKSYLRLLENKVPEESGMRDELLVLKEEIDRVVRIVRQLSEPVPEGALLTEINLNAVVGDLLMLYGEPLFTQRGIAFSVRLDPAVPQVRADRDGLKQVLLNLLKNASEALSAGAEVEVQTSAVMLHEGVRHAGFVVRDSGPGIPLAVVQRLYAPMPELPPGSRGMGLSIIGGLVRHMQGRVICETQQGQGTRISILLPPTDGSASIGETV